MRTRSFPYIFALGLFSGTLNSIVLKLCYQTTSMGTNDEEHFFHKPWFMSMVMFGAMLVALPLYYFFDSSRKNKPISLKTWLVVSIPSVCDLVGSSMQQIGLIFTPVSIYQMLKGSILLFSAALSVMFLKKRMYRHNWVGVSMCVVALSLVGVSSVMTIDDQPVVVSYWESVFGIVIVVLGQVVCASQYVLEEFLLKPPNDVSAMAMVGMEGLWGSALMTGIFLPLFQSVIKGADVGGVYENTSDTLEMITNSSSLQWLLLIQFMSVFVYNVCGVMVTQQASAVHHTFLDSTRTVFVWIASVAVYYHPTSDRSFGEPLTYWSIVEFLGFVILIVGECIYDQLIPLPGTKELIDPRMSPVRIPSMAPSPHGFQIARDSSDELKSPLL